MADETLLMLVREIRGKTLKQLADVGPEQARFAPAGLVNSVLWHAGHILVVNEHLGVVAATHGTPSYPAGYFETFSWKSAPATVTDWPELRDVIKLLEEQKAKLEHFVAGAPEEVLAGVTDPARGRTLRYSILHGLHDEAGHQGEIHLLKKLWTKQNTPI